MSRRNRGKHTDVAIVEANIVAHMRKHRCGRANPLPASSIAEAGFPGYRFRNSQGAALAVSRILRGMVDRGVLRPSIGGHGYYLADTGGNADGVTRSSGVERREQPVATDMTTELSTAERGGQASR